jgi:hypothetical protein
MTKELKECPIAYTIPHINPCDHGYPVNRKYGLQGIHLGCQEWGGTEDTR